MPPVCRRLVCVLPPALLSSTRAWPLMEIEPALPTMIEAVPNETLLIVSWALLTVMGASMSVVPLPPFQVIGPPEKVTADARVQGLAELLVNELPLARLIVPPLMPVVLTTSDESQFWPVSVSVLALFCTRTPLMLLEFSEGLIGASVVGPALLTTSVLLLTMPLVFVNWPSW